MGSVNFPGQVVRFIGTTRLSVSNTILSATSTVDRIFAAENPSDPALITYVAGNPDFLQGFTQFVPCSSYQVFNKTAASLPITGTGLANFIPPVSSAQAQEGVWLRSGIAYFTQTSANPFNIFT